MTKKEFREKIALAREYLVYRKWDGKRRGVCEALGFAFDTYFDEVGSVPNTFRLIFSPERPSMYWLGDRDIDNQETLDNRRDFLNHFEEYMVVNQYYLAY